MKMRFAVKKIALALALAGCSISLSWAASTGSTASVKGTVPVLSAPSNNVDGAVDFSGTYAIAGKLSTGDSVVMSYDYADAEGDADNTLTTVAWSYAPAGGGADVAIAATNVAATVGTPGTSTITIPVGAVMATAIKVTVTETSATGDPLTSRTIVVTDTSAGGGAGGGGGSVTPQGPVIPGAGVMTGGIFLVSASPTAGSGAVDYSRTAGYPQVNDIFVFRAWADTNGDGIWDAGEADVTATLGSIQWQLDGTNSSASGTSAAVTLNNQPIPGATTDTYTVPVNSASSSGAASGDQGFNLKVDFN